jgi:hypothetical protein
LPMAMVAAIFRSDMDLVATCGGGWEVVRGPATAIEAAKQSAAAGALRNDIISDSPENN